MDRRLNGTTSEHTAFGSVNATGDDSNRIYLERVPTWGSAAATWGWGWQMHVYGLGACYFTLCLLSGVALVLIRKRWKAYRFLIFALLMLFLTGLMRGMYYVLDPYDYKRELSATLNRLLLQLANPALPGAFSAIQRMTLRLTKLDVGSNKLQKTSFMATVIFFHFLITLLVETVVCENRSAKPLLVLSHGYFIFWTTFLCVSFIYNGFKLTHYTSETQRALKELSFYSQAKKNDGSSIKRQIPRSVTQQRLMKPRIKITNEENKTCSIVSDSDESTDSDFEDSRNSTSFSKGESDKETETIPTPKKKISNRSSQRDFGRQNCTYEYSHESHTRHNGCEERISETSSDVSDKEGPIEICSISRTSARILRGFRKQTTNISREGEMLVGGRSSHGDTCRQDIREKVKRKGSCINNSVISKVFPNGYRADLQLRTMSDCIVCDTGYMADTESSFTSRKSNKRSSSCSDFKDADDSMMTPVSMVTSPSTLSLHRIRQGRMIHKVIVATYVATFLGFVVCLLQLYSVFGSYGIFGSNPEPEPWPWLLFQTFTRLTEIGMGGAVGVAGFIVIRHRKQRNGFRKWRFKKTVFGSLI